MKLLIKRSGYSLIEMLVVILIAATLLGASITLVAAMMKNEKGGRQRLQFDVSFDRLEKSFRDDVHASTGVKIEENGEKMKLTGSKTTDGEVCYAFLDGELTREEFDGGKIVRSDAFFVPNECRGVFEQSADSEKTTVRLKIAAIPGDLQNYKSPPIRIAAVLNRDRPIEIAAPKKTEDEKEKSDVPNATENKK